MFDRDACCLLQPGSEGNQRDPDCNRPTSPTQPPNQPNATTQQVPNQWPTPTSGNKLAGSSPKMMVSSRESQNPSWCCPPEAFTPWSTEVAVKAPSLLPLVVPQLPLKGTPFPRFPPIQSARPNNRPNKAICTHPNCHPTQPSPVRSQGTQSQKVATPGWFSHLPLAYRRCARRATDTRTSQGARVCPAATYCLDPSLTAV